MKYTYTSILSLFFSQIFYSDIFATPAPNCDWLPWCDTSSNTVTFDVIWSLIATVIQYVAVIAVLALMYWGILYLFSSGEEEKTKKAKNVIIWALVWVLVSASAFLLINILNNFRL